MSSVYTFTPLKKSKNLFIVKIKQNKQNIYYQVNLPFDLKMLINICIGGYSIVVVYIAH